MGYYYSTQHSAKAMLEAIDHAKATCQPSCHCDPDAKWSRIKENGKDGLGRWWRRPRKGLAQRSDDPVTGSASSSAVFREIGPFSASPSNALRPRTDAGSSIPDSPPTATQWLRSTLRPARCVGNADGLECTKYCSCDLYDTIKCGTPSNALIEAFTNRVKMPHGKAVALVKQRAGLITLTCRSLCHCRENPPPLASVSSTREANLEAAEKEEQEMGQKLRTDNLLRRSGNKSTDSPAAPPSSTSACNPREHSPSVATLQGPFSDIRNEASPDLQSQPWLPPPSFTPLNINQMICFGQDAAFCKERCYCNLYNALSCDRRFESGVKALAGVLSTENAINVTLKYTVAVLNECSKVCSCLQPRARGNKSEAQLRDERRGRVLLRLYPKRSDDRSTSLAPFTSFSPLQTRSDAHFLDGERIFRPQPKSRPPPLILPQPRFAPSASPEEIESTEEERLFCRERCRCSPDGSLLCNKKFVAGHKSLVGIMARDKALETVMRQTAAVAAQCGLVCHCGDILGGMGLSALGAGEKRGTGVGLGLVGVGARLKVEIVRGEGDIHGKAIAKRARDAILFPSTAENPSLPPLYARSGVGPSASKATSSFPPSNAASSSGPRNHFTPVNCHSNPMANQFCKERCFCTPAGLVSCEKWAGAQIAALNRLGIPLQSAKQTARIYTEENTKECGLICDCSEEAGKEEEASGNKPVIGLPPNLFTHFHELRVAAHTALNPRRDSSSGTK